MNDWDPLFERPRLESVRANNLELSQATASGFIRWAGLTFWTSPWREKSRRSKRSNRILKIASTWASFSTTIPAATWVSCQPGHCFYFGIDEVEPFTPDTSPSEAT